MSTESASAIANLFSTLQTNGAETRRTREARGSEDTAWLQGYEAGMLIAIRAMRSLATVAGFRLESLGMAESNDTTRDWFASAFNVVPPTQSSLYVPDHEPYQTPKEYLESVRELLTTCANDKRGQSDPQAHDGYVKALRDALALLDGSFGKSDS